MLCHFMSEITLNYLNIGSVTLNLLTKNSRKRRKEAMFSVGVLYCLFQCMVVLQ